MLFVKYISDVLKEKKEEYISKYDGDVTRIERAMKHERFKVPNQSTFEFLYEKRNEDNLGELINIFLEDIEEANRLLGKRTGSGTIKRKGDIGRSFSAL